MENVREERLVSYRIYADRVWIMHTCINVLLLFLTAETVWDNSKGSTDYRNSSRKCAVLYGNPVAACSGGFAGRSRDNSGGKTFFCLIAALWWVQRCFQVKSREGMRRVWICYMCCACVLGGVCSGISEVRELFGTVKTVFEPAGRFP